MLSGPAWKWKGARHFCPRSIGQNYSLAHLDAGVLCQEGGPPDIDGMWGLYVT